MFFPIQSYQGAFPFAGVGGGFSPAMMGAPGALANPGFGDAFCGQTNNFNPGCQAQGSGQMVGMGMMMGLMMGMMCGGGMGMGGMGMGMPGMGMGGMGMGGMMGGFSMAPMMQMMMMELMQMSAMQQGMGMMGNQAPPMWPGMQGMQAPPMWNGGGMPGMGMPQMPYNNYGGNYGGNYGQVPYSPYAQSPNAPAFPPQYGGNRAMQAVANASSQVGVTGGNPAVRGYSQGRSEAWCADFVSSMYERTPGGSPFGHRPGVASIRSWGQQQGLYHPRGTYPPRPGDILIFGNNQHTGIVERVDPDGTVHTIEGNSNGYGFQGGESANQGAVASPTLSANSSWITGYVDMQNYQ